MELRYILKIIWKWAWLIIIAVAISALASYLTSRSAAKLYRTKTTLMVGRATQALDSYSYNVYVSQQLALTYAKLATSKPVLQGTIDSLNLDTDWRWLQGQVNAQPIAQTELLEIWFVDSNPERAKVLADTVAEQLILQSSSSVGTRNSEQTAFTQTQIEDLKIKINNAQEQIEVLKQERDASSSAQQIQSLDTQISILDNKISDWQSTYSNLITTLEGADFNALSIIEDASIPSYPFSPNIPRNVITASMIGLVLALAGIFFIEYLDDTIKNPEDVERTVKLTTLASIPRMDGGSYPDKLITLKNPMQPISEAYRSLRTNLQFSSLDEQLHTIMLSSPGPSEGKSLTLANLAVVMAQSDLKVILVDTDLRRPTLHKIFNLPNRYGLSDLALNPQLSISQRLQATGVNNLWLLSSGSLPPNPAELISSDRLKHIIEELRTQADYVLFDTPPVLVVSDALTLSTNLDGVVLVYDVGKTRSNDAKRAVQELNRIRSNVLGVVLNRVTPRSSGYYYSYYYYDYYRGGEEKRRKTKRSWLGERIATINQLASKSKES